MPNIKAVADKKIFSCFPYISLSKHVTHFWSKGHNLNKLGRGPLGDATYQIPRPRGLRLEDFFIFSLYKFMQNM